MSNIFAQDSIKINNSLLFQQELNKEYASEETSPLEPKVLKTFISLDFFEIDPLYIVTATFVRTPHEAPFVMKTSTSREPLYVKYGEAHFTLFEKEWVLNIYQSQGLQTEPEYKNYLFLPFTDLTNGETSYGGGRFIDLEIPSDGIILIDFNKAYNPYCAYSVRYSCPVPPAENHLELSIKAGVRKKIEYEVSK